MGKQHFLIEKREEGEFMKIGLLGFEFDSPNKGCEALGYSFVSLIKKNYPDKVEFYVFTNDELGLFPEYFDDICFEKVPLKIKDFSFQMIKTMRKCDFIFDVTLGDSFSDIYSIDQCLSNIRFKFLAEIFGRKYILLPQTYGPFEDKKCRDRSIHILNHADYIFCRDKKSMEYIRALGIKSTHLQLTTDMAFALPYNEEKYTIDSNNIKIGINVSGLLWKGGFERKNQFGLSFDYRQFIYDILTYFTDKVNAEVYLIPHVIDNAESARDYGIVTTYNSWVSIISMFISLALYMGIRLSFVDYEKKVNDFLSTILLFTFSYGCCILAFVCVIAYILPVSVNIGIIVLCLLQSLGSALIEEVSQFLLMQVRYKFRTAIMIIPNLISTIVAVVVIRYVLRSNLYLGRIVPTAMITFGIGIGVALYFLPKGKITINSNYLTYALKLSLPLVLHGIALNILSQSDRTMITWLKDSRETGIYGLIYNFSMIATVITTAFDGIWVPFFMDNMKKGDSKAINEYFLKYIELMTIAMIGVILVGPEVVKLLSTREYWQGIVIIPPIVLSNYLIFIYTLYVYIEHFYKKTVFISVNTTIAAVSNIVMNYFFILKWGYTGAAYSTLISYGLSLILHYIYSRRLNKTVLPFKDVLLHLILILIIVALFYIFVNVWLMRWIIALICVVFLVVKERAFIMLLLKK